MKKDKLTFIEEKKIEKEIKKSESEFVRNNAQSNPIKSQFVKFRLNKKKMNYDDLI